MKEGKPIKEAKEYLRELEEEKKQREEGNWCNHISARKSGGFHCLKSPIRGPYEDPCSNDDFSDCPFNPKNAKLAVGSLEDR